MGGRSGGDDERSGSSSGGVLLRGGCRADVRGYGGY